jgi:hypothetical protein
MNNFKQLTVNKFIHRGKKKEKIHPSILMTTFVNIVLKSMLLLLLLLLLLLQNYVL